VPGAIFIPIRSLNQGLRFINAHATFIISFVAYRTSLYTLIIVNSISTRRADKTFIACILAKSAVFMALYALI
jgi:hypothetical protein